MGSVTNAGPITIPAQPPIRVTVQYVVTKADPPNVPGGVQVGSGSTVVADWVLQQGETFTWASGGQAVSSGNVYAPNAITSQAVGGSPLPLNEQIALHAMQPSVPPPDKPIQVVESRLVVTVSPAGSAIQVVP